MRDDTKDGSRIQCAIKELGMLFMALLLFGSAGCHTTRNAFYPLGIYSVPTTNDLATVRKAGFNLVTGPASAPFLNAARALGLRVLASPQTSAGPDFNASLARQAVRRWDAHPALWAWYLIDEPDLNRVPPADVLNAHRFLKNLGARKPTALVLYQGYRALDYARHSDILMIDRYPIPWLPLANFPQHVRMARLAVGQEKPLIAVLQAFDWTAYPDLLPEEKNLRPPTSAELRAMTYCALAQRANGLFFYCLNDGKWNVTEHPDTWEALKQVVAEVNRRLPLFQAEHIWWPYLHQFKDPRTRFNAALESSVSPTLLRVRRGNEFVPVGDYVRAVNTPPSTQVYRFYLPQPLSGTIPVLGEERSRQIEDNWIEDEFEPFAVHVYGPLPQEHKPQRSTPAKRGNQRR